MVGYRYKCAAVIISLFCAVIILAPTIAAQDDLSIRISIDRKKISMGQTATLTVTISAANQQTLPEPKLPPLPRFDIYSAGSSTNLQIINGETSYSKTTSYILAPKKTGIYPIRSAWAVINGKRYESNQLSLEVTDTPTGSSSAGAGRDNAGEAKDMFLTAEVDKRTAYVDEQITLSIKFYSALKLSSNPDYIPPQTPDFWDINIPPQNSYYETINGRDYLIRELRRALFPTKPGQLTIGKSQVTATVPDRSRKRSRDPFSFFGDIFQTGKRVSVRSQPITIGVKPLPLEGKTPEFSGGVGDYRISATVDKNEVEVNEAITLTVQISGKGNVQLIPEPTLPRLDNYRVEKSSSDFNQTNLGDDIGGSKTFEYILIPRLPGKQTIDRLSLNYFDPKKGKYLTVTTEPIALSVQQGELVAGTEIPYNVVSGQTINLKETDIRFIRTGNGHLVPKGRLLLTTPSFMFVLALPLVVLLGGMIDVRRRRKLTGDVAYARVRKANVMARKRLKRAEELLGKTDNGAFYTEVSNVILQYIADKCNLSAHGLTSDSVKDILVRKNVNEDLCRELLEIIEQADFGRFAGGATSGEPRQLFERVRQAMVDLEGSL